MMSFRIPAQETAETPEHLAREFLLYMARFYGLDRAGVIALLQGEKETAPLLPQKKGSETPLACSWCGKPSERMVVGDLESGEAFEVWMCPDCLGRGERILLMKRR